MGTARIRRALVAGAIAVGAVAGFLPAAPAAAGTNTPGIVWAEDRTSYYVQRWVVQDPAYAAGQGRARDFTSKVACAVAAARFGGKGKTGLKVSAQTRSKMPQWLRNQVRDEVEETACEKVLSWAFENAPPMSAWPKAKASNSCLRIDFDLIVWQAPDNDPRYCAPLQHQGPRIVPPVNEPPVADFTWARKAGPGNVVMLDGTRSRDAENRIVAYRWTSGRDTLGSGPRLTVAMGSRREVTLWVTDHGGSRAGQTKTLHLGNRAPVIRDVSPGADGVAGSNTPTLRAVAADDDGDGLQYSYSLTGPHVSLSSGWVGGAWTVPPHRLDPGTRYSWTVTVRDAKGATASRTSAFSVAMLPTANDIVSTSDGKGYWQVASDGGVFSYGNAPFHGSLPGLGIRANDILGMARTPTNGGYWLVGRNGGVYAFGDAGFHGSLPGLGVAVDNIVGMAPTKDGRGYWLVGSDGGVFAFGNAGFHGSMGGNHLNAPIEAIGVTASGNGYWLAARDGGVFAYGDAPYHGGMGGHRLNSPVVDLDVVPDGGGYWLTAEDGGVFTYGNARFHGSMAGKPLNGRVTGMGPTHDGSGYWLSACDGGVFAFGNAPFAGARISYTCRGIG